MSAHRYWRLTVTDSGVHNQTALSGIYMYETSARTDIFAGHAIAPSVTNFVGGDPYYITDGVFDGHYLAWGMSSGSPGVVTWDFGTDPGPKDLIEIAFQSIYGNGSYRAFAPTDFTFAWSDDATTFTTVYTAVALDNSTSYGPDATTPELRYFALSSGPPALAAGVATGGSVTTTTAGATATEATGGTSPYGHQWYRSTASGTLGSAVSGQTSLTLADTGLTPGTAYFYTLKYTDAAAATVNSNQISVTTAATTATAVRFVLENAASGLSGMKAIVFNLASAGDVGTKLFTRGYSNSPNTTPLTFATAGSGNITVDVPLPGSVTPTIGDTLKGYFENSTVSTSIITGTVV